MEQSWLNVKFIVISPQYLKNFTRMEKFGSA